MIKFFAAILLATCSSFSFAAAHAGAPMSGAAPVEAMKAGDAKAQAAGQAKVDARPTTGNKAATQPEAMKAGDAKSQMVAEKKKASKPKKAKKASADAQMATDAKKL